MPGYAIHGSLWCEMPTVYGHADDGLAARGLAVNGVNRAEPVGMTPWVVLIYPLAIANHMFMKIFLCRQADVLPA